ncbi:hypothetical protein [Paenibacillus sp. Z6-24]
MNKKILTSLLLSSALLLPTAYSQPIQAAATETKYEWSYYGEGDSGSTQEVSTIMRNGIPYIEFNFTAMMAGLKYSQDSTGKRAGFNGWIKKLESATAVKSLC